MKIIFFGLGSVGKRHARLIKENFNHELYAFRSKGKRKNELGIKEIYALKEIDNLKPDVAFITNPTSEHMKYALFCAEKGMDLFIEKPLSNNKKDLKKLRRIVKKNDLKCYTAYCLRFHPVITWLKNYLIGKKPLHVAVNTSSYLPNWRDDNHLESYSAQQKMGGGVILDLSHEIDYLYYLLGDIKIVKGQAKKISDVTIDSEDFADILLEFKDTFANVHLNFMSRLNKREIILNFKDHTILADLINNKVNITDEKERTLDFNIERDDIFLKQLNYFFSEHKNMNDIDESLKVFDIITKVKKVAQ